MVTYVESVTDYKSRSERYIEATISDSHIGAKSADLDLLKGTVQWIDKHADAWIFNGDACDAINFKDKRFDIDSVDPAFFTPRLQYKEFKRIIKPIAYKCDVLNGGNHDRTNKRQNNGDDRLRDIAEDLDIPYAETSAFIRKKFRRGRHWTKFDIYAHHGAGGSRTKGGKINKVQKMDQLFEADIYLMGHVHDLVYLKDPIMTFDKRGRLTQRLRYYVLTGGFLKGYEEGSSNYVEEGMYKPTSLGGIFLSLDMERATTVPVQLNDIPVSVRGI